MKQSEINNIPLGTKIHGFIGGRPARLKYKNFSSWGIQTDDIGGEYVEVPEIPAQEVIGVVVEGPHPHGRKPGKMFKFLEYTGKKGTVCRTFLKNVKQATITE